MAYQTTHMGHVAEARGRHEPLARQLLEVVGELLAVLEVPDEGRDVVETAEGQLVPPGELGGHGLGFVAEDDLLDDADTLLTQDLQLKEVVKSSSIPSSFFLPRASCSLRTTG